MADTSVPERISFSNKEVTYELQFKDYLNIMGMMTKNTDTRRNFVILFWEYFYRRLSSGKSLQGRPSMLPRKCISVSRIQEDVVHG